VQRVESYRNQGGAVVTVMVGVDNPDIWCVGDGRGYGSGMVVAAASRSPADLRPPVRTAARWR
jgi:hypothetical protein